LTVRGEPEICQWPSEFREAYQVAKEAKNSINRDKSVLILAPKKEFFPLISAKLSELDVPFTCQDNLLSEQINKRMNAVKHFISWIINPSNSFLTRLIIEELINTGIAKVTGARKNGRCSPKTIENRIAEEKEIAMLWELVDRNNGLYKVINTIETKNKTLVRIREGLFSLLNSYNNNPGEFFNQLSIVSGIWKDPSYFANDMTSVVELLQTKRPMGTSSVQLMTMRKAKGLEADIVIIVGLENDIMPNPYSDIVEDARLFYVSMTRAIEKVFLFYSNRRPSNISYGKFKIPKERSVFLDIISR